MNIWALCDGKNWIGDLSIDPWRVVEAQHVLSTRDLVDTLEEHDLLEELIETSKPAIKKEKNYLLFTPFRYPPLKYGSRFGHTYEPSLWYGSLELETAFAEVAYYRLQFLNDSIAELGFIEISLTAFMAYIETNCGVDLTQEVFKKYYDSISNKNDHDDSQTLGSCMREDRVEAFIYYSARTKELQKNCGVFTPSVFKHKKNQSVRQQQHWKCLSNKQEVEFTRMDVLGKKRFTFSKHYYQEI